MSYLLDYNPGTRQWGYPRRGARGFLTGTCIVHTAECAADNIGEDTSAEGCARMIANRADYGSYHRLVDSDSIIDMLPWEYEAWQDSETNNWAVGISAALRTTDWAVMPADRRNRVYRNLAACAADFVRYMAGRGVSVPLRRITGGEARAGVAGFCAHGDSGVARSDPGVDFDWALFFKYTAEALGSAASGEDDDMALFASIEDFKAAVVEAVEAQHRVTRTDTAKNVLNMPVPYYDPRTGERTAQTTTLATMVGYADFQAAQTRLHTDAKSVAASIPDGIAQEVLDLLAERLGGK